MTALSQTIQKSQLSEFVFSDESKFENLYPKKINELAHKHWTSLAVAKCAADFLTPQTGTKVLDIGSGVGKFCLTAAHTKPGSLFYGIEQRKDLVDYANKANQLLKLPNVSFIHGNFTQIDLTEFDSFYFYNAFYENIAYSQKIDNDIDYSASLFNYYNRYLYKQLAQMPDGTRIATFHSLEDEIPPCYFVVKTDYEGLLKFWIKVTEKENEF
jgi:cyclopropane fatty-acyl-phospholipid synthase-like methyltransferase